MDTSSQNYFSHGYYHKPSISVIPSPNVALGGNFYIQCGSGYYKGGTFDLFKGESALHVRSETASYYTVDFHISEAKLEHGGMYQCRYCFDGTCSHLSDRLYINVTASPKPSISVSPGEVISLAGNASIHCKTKEQQEVEFTLHIENSSNTYESKKMGSGEVLFPIINAKESDGGIYRCSYCLKFVNTQACSNYSDEVHIKVTADTFPSMESNIRLGVAGLVLLSLVLIVAEFMWSQQG
ncbi:leukocyte immunoglobulin-like receptor subfamily A member 1 [Zootoca vivipara]|uniref:leukocyte immunoglobulin-like receptor subfamily A member 1 n=1 Tax=Zootoca vivipara TaxID=8524 RepID=UPI00293BE21A|nr:leukocyte immunoglobulin-like receptor subfamily A member 1 [Zootoca vivipara]